MTSIAQQSVAVRNAEQNVKTETGETQNKADETRQTAVVKNGQSLFDVLKEAKYPFPSPYTHQQADRVIALMVQLNPDELKNPNLIHKGDVITLPTRAEFAQALRAPAAPDKYENKKETFNLNPPLNPLSLPPSRKPNSERRAESVDLRNEGDTSTWKELLNKGEYAEAIASLIDAKDIVEEERAVGFQEIARAAFNAGDPGAGVWAASELQKRGKLSQEFREPLKKILEDPSKIASETHTIASQLLAALDTPVSNIEADAEDVSSTPITQQVDALLNQGEFQNAYDLASEFRDGAKTKNTLLQKIVLATAPVADSNPEANEALLAAVRFVRDNQALTKREKTAWVEILWKTSPQVTTGSTREELQALTREFLKVNEDAG